MAIVNKTKTGVLPHDLQEKINLDGAIVPTCDNVDYDGVSALRIEFSVALSGPEDTALDALLSTYTAPTPILANSIADNDDIDITSVVPIEGDNLTWNNTTGKFEPKTPTVVGVIEYQMAYQFEENSTSTGYMAIGNGAANSTGFYIHKSGFITGVSATTRDTVSNGSYEARINQVSVGAVTFNGTGGYLEFVEPVAVVAGDKLTCFSTNGQGGVQTATIFVSHPMTVDGLLKGDQGLQGDAGVASYLSGAGVPSNGLGSDGDAYANETNGDFYLKATGSWSLKFNTVGPQGIQGATGNTGTNGYTLLNGIVAPTSEGVNGDFYIDTVTNLMYGPKAGGAWGSSTNIVGTNGSDGVVQFRFGSGVPSAGLGADGDAYFNDVNGDYYSKITGAWVFQFNSSGASVYGLSGAKFTSATATSVNSTSDTLIPFETTSFIDAPFTNTSSTLKTINTTGRYRIKADLDVNGTTGNYRWTGLISLRKNGVTILRSKYGGYIRATSGANYNTLGIDENFDFVATDTIEILVKRSSTTSGNATLVPNQIVLELTRVK